MTKTGNKIIIILFPIFTIIIYIIKSINEKVSTIKKYIIDNNTKIIVLQKMDSCLYKYEISFRCLEVVQKYKKMNDL